MNLEPLYLVGPTATGKSALALELAERLDGEIVNADALQLYQDLRICTAQPSPADLARVPHHLFGVIPVTETCDARLFSELAQAAIAAITARSRIPIITGGSGLYVKSLTHGLEALPASAFLRSKLSHLTMNERIEWLLHRDSRAAENVNLTNDRRVTRALEICLLSGLPQSDLRRAWQEKVPSFRGIRLTMDRPALNARIHRRIRKMVDAGLLDEVRRLPAVSATAEKAIGIREIRAHLAGDIGLPQAMDAMQISTRQYARRQETWFKREPCFCDLPVREGMTPAELADAAIALLPGLLTRSRRP